MQSKRAGKRDRECWRGREEGAGHSLNKMVRKALLRRWHLDQYLEGGERRSPMYIRQQNLLGSGTGKHRPEAEAGWAHRSNSKEAVRHWGQVARAL